MKQSRNEQMISDVCLNRRKASSFRTFWVDWFLENILASSWPNLRNRFVFPFWKKKKSAGCLWDLKMKAKQTWAVKRKIWIIYLTTVYFSLKVISKNKTSFCISCICHRANFIYLSCTQGPHKWFPRPKMARGHTLVTPTLVDEALHSISEIS